MPGLVLTGNGGNDPADELALPPVDNGFPEPEVDGGWIILATTSAAIREISSWDKELEVVEVDGTETSPDADVDITGGRIWSDGALCEASPFITNNPVKHEQTSRTQQHYHYPVSLGTI